MQNFSVSIDDLPVPAVVLEELNAKLDEFLLVGSIARDIWVHDAAGLPRGRLTEDLDISVSVATRTELSHITKQLHGPTSLGIRYDVAGHPVDIIPYGGIAPAGFIEPTPGVYLDIRGMSEAKTHCVQLSVTDSLTVDCASLESLVVLKAIAWGMRQSTTKKDAQDISLLFDASYRGAFAEECWNDDAAGQLWDYEPSLMGPYRIGRFAHSNFSIETLEAIRTYLGGRDEIQKLAAQMSSTMTAPRIDQVKAFLQGVGS